MPLTVALSCIALAVSLTTAWFTLFHRGTVKITRPRFVALVRGDGPDPDAPKIFIRMLLYSTGKRGRAVETLFAKVRRGDATQLFLFWSYGETNDLRVGSGLYVGPDGHTANHHFVLLPDAPPFPFEAGAYEIEIYATFPRRSRAVLLHTAQLTLSANASQQLRDDPSVAIYFNWDPVARVYQPHVNRKPRPMLKSAS
jgi:hypothetical protein